jgi:hypothetical protein
MATNTYDEFRGAIDAAGLGKLPRWSELDEPAQEQAFRVLRRLAVARALDGGDAFSVIEVEAGLGEDAALRTFLLSTALLMAAEGPIPKGDRDPVGAMLEARLPESVLTELLDDCWIYRDDALVAWTPLHAVRTGFDRKDDKDFVRLTAARKRWDEADRSTQVDWVGEAVVALMALYAQGTPQAADSPRKIFADHALRRSLRDAAKNERFSLLSDGAFTAIDAKARSVDAVDVKLDGDEAYVRRSQCDPTLFAEWSASLKTWKPDGGDGDTAFAWGAGVAISVCGGSLADWLQRGTEALLAGMIREQRLAA